MDKFFNTSDDNLRKAMVGFGKYFPKILADDAKGRADYDCVLRLMERAWLWHGAEGLTRLLRLAADKVKSRSIRNPFACWLSRAREIYPK